MKNGKKFDRGKPRFDLIDASFHEDLARVMTMGAAKYNDNNWQQVQSFLPRYIAALERHVNAIKKHEAFDQESGLQHAAHVAANAMFIHWYFKNTKDTHEDSDLRRHKGNPGQSDPGPRAVDKDGVRFDTDETDSHRQICHALLDQIFDTSESREYIGTLLSDIVIGGDKSVTVGSDNETSCRELHECESALR